MPSFDKHFVICDRRRTRYKLKVLSNAN
jgi:hypothetical protein